MKIKILLIITLTISFSCSDYRKLFKTEGYEKKLEINGVGYRAKLSTNKLELSLGFSHPVEYQLPEGVTAELPSQTEIVLKSTDKQKIGQAAAEIRNFRPPEPYKGKGVKYSDEIIRRKESKKA